jgi:branched-chain amino acid transport system permease protein
VSLFLQYLSSGVASGCTFALVATGFVAIYRVTRVVNFAQGAFAVVGGMAAYTLLAHGLPHFVAEGLAVAAAAAVGLLVGLVAIGRRGTPPLASLIITLGLGIGMYAVLILVFGDQPVSYDGVAGAISGAGVTMPLQFLLVVAVTAATFVLLAFFFNATYLGRALTACSSNPHAARLVGIDTTRMGLVSFALGGALGGLAGVLLAPLQPVAFDSDVGLAINGFAAAVFGGILRPGTALAGALVLGVAEAMVAGYSRASFESGVALVLMLALMIWQASRRPVVEEGAA